MRVNRAEIVLRCGDITHERADAIVNAANSSLLGGGGVDGAIHRAAGPSLLEQCRAVRAERGECAPGDAVITRAGDLAALYVIHTVGPLWTDGEQGERDTLARCHERCLELAVEAGCSSVAFPAISTGAYRFPMDEAARVALTTTVAWLDAHDVALTVRFVLFDSDGYRAFYRELSLASERAGTAPEGGRTRR